ncbi:MULTISPECIES: M14-type cytosolic carboxypeptidase [Paraburkholderia]|uniref:M14 family metallopeptidase n=1 Tax=Paraburkholderia TaxID=1822464 RepID=UPI002253F97C|nr:MULTISPECIES: M14-type cytosolic carboxypeptidase [Paraburkholderia]MCX4165539.1 M14-type cytosolic carboxypeptidase [Paraburkholderia megapolitana]MDN7161030.1 M14-type cytosolic carboxypeptidase [Paraburkholderia sp. CHISQ3]MDQ6498077.1 M14-type cytosolic carboxypeptidase [Paraburkholderia megapolitana]
MTLSITSNFDAGAIDVVSCTQADDIRLRVRPDSHADFAQWFYFRLTGARGERCVMTFENAADCAFAAGWRDYQAAASYDRVNWFRVPTTYDGRVLTIDHTPDFDSIYYAYFEPYSEERHSEFLGAVQQMPHASLTELGRTVEGRPMSLLTLGAPDTDADDAGDASWKPKKKVWIIARQHPGETMAEWFVEGLVKRLAGWGDWAGDPVARKLYDHATFYIVPNMNPDGSVRGNLRTNATGANLNREWLEPDAARSPEVLVVRDAIHATGCDLFFDVHGDEALPYVFVAGSEMLPGFTEQQGIEQKAFVEAFKQASPDFQDKYGYEASKYRQDALKLASKYIGHTFGCLSLTLEMPFKDNANLPDERVGWNGERSASLGAAMLQAILRHVETFD